MMTEKLNDRISSNETAIGGIEEEIPKQDETINEFTQIVIPIDNEVVSITSQINGLKNQIEGYIEKGSKLVVIEDLISTGKSSLKAIKALRNKNLNVVGMLSIFSYNFDFANERFQKENISINSLADYNTLVEMIIAEGSITYAESNRLMEWRKDPQSWS